MERLGELKLMNQDRVLRLNPIDLGRSRHRVYLHEGRVEDFQHEFSPHPHIGFNIRHNRLILAGIWLPENMRGCRFGDLLLEVAFRIAEGVGSPLERTASIRKPLLAKKLTDFGFTGQSNSTLAEILPRNGATLVPTVRIQTERESLPKRYDSWFEQVDGELDPCSGNPILPIYTPYVLTDSVRCEAKRDFTYMTSDAKIQVFPRRVRRHFGF